jgi:hypothetical protein
MIFWQSNAPLTLKKKVEIFSSLATVVHIQLKLKIWICHKNALVNFEFGHGLMIAHRVIPLELLKKIRNFKFLFIIDIVKLCSLELGGPVQICSRDQ